ncbi:hypothetical protein L1987_45987 [Smallanthus sonchifolius]|uniref:Uncharacterized protein n=1 Tax=Smallanthus sonchifolius TaxID=185202 RepID=A0ACB9FZG0_9ASTR|nr:hypothetical protein L1987_45987 [Smallanthus sonchifolius]
MACSRCHRRSGASVSDYLVGVRMTATMYADGYIDGVDMHCVDVDNDDEEQGGSSCKVAGHVDPSATPINPLNAVEGKLVGTSAGGDDLGGGTEVEVIEVKDSECSGFFPRQIYRGGILHRYPGLSKVYGVGPTVDVASIKTPEAVVPKPSSPKPHTDAANKSTTSFEREVDEELLKWMDKLSDLTATALATLSFNYSEICRRAEYDIKHLILSILQKKKLEDDLSATTEAFTKEIAKILEANQLKMKHLSLEWESERSVHASAKASLEEKVSRLLADKNWVLENGFTLAHAVAKLEAGYWDKLYFKLRLEGKLLPPPIGDVQVLLSHAYDALSDVDPEILDDIHDLADEDGIASLKTLLEPFGASDEDE